MSGRVLQQLLESGEYDEFDDIIIVEGEFVEFGASGPALGQVILGLSPFHLLKATRNISDYKKNPDVYYNTDVDPFLDGLEIASIVPLCILELKYLAMEYEITVAMHGDVRYYLLCNSAINGHMDDTWYRWIERVQYIQRDPYHYIRDILDEHNLEYPDHYMELELEDIITKSAENTDTKRVAFADLDNGNVEDAIDTPKGKIGKKRQAKGSKRDDQYAVEDKILGKGRKRDKKNAAESDNLDGGVKKKPRKKDKTRRKNTFFSCLSANKEC